MTKMIIIFLLVLSCQRSDVSSFNESKNEISQLRSFQVSEVESGSLLKKCMDSCESDTCHKLAISYYSQLDFDRAAPLFSKAGECEMLKAKGIANAEYLQVIIEKSAKLIMPEDSLWKLVFNHVKVAGRVVECKTPFGCVYASYAYLPSFEDQNGFVTQNNEFLIKKACDISTPKSGARICFDYASYLEQGGDKKLALEYFEKTYHFRVEACNQGEGNECLQLGHWHKNGYHGFMIDYQKARDFYNKAYKLGKIELSDIKQFMEN